MSFKCSTKLVCYDFTLHNFPLQAKTDTQHEPVEGTVCDPGLISRTVDMSDCLVCFLF